MSEYTLVQVHGDFPDPPHVSVEFKLGAGAVLVLEFSPQQAIWHGQQLIEHGKRVLDGKLK
jgi:hypothetical protein